MLVIKVSSKAGAEEVLSAFCRYKQFSGTRPQPSAAVRNRGLIQYHLWLHSYRVVPTVQSSNGDRNQSSARSASGPTGRNCMGVFERTNLMIRIKNFKVIMHFQGLLGFTAVDATRKKEAINCVHALGISVHHLDLPAYEEKRQIVLY